MNSFWKNKKVLITGHTGFKGAWLSEVLNFFGSQVYGLSIKPEKGIYETINTKNVFKDEEFADIVKQSKKIENFFLKTKPEIVFHFAAQSLVPSAAKFPQKTLKTNILGTFNMLELCNKIESVNSLIIATTDKVYNNSETWNRETSPLGGKEIYSISKVSAELLIENFINNLLRNNLKISIVRSGNVIGGGDRGKGRLFNDLLYSIINNKPLKIRNLNGIRPWQDILDSLSGYIKVAEYTDKERISEIFNLNSKTNNKYTVENLINIYKEQWGDELNYFLEKNNFLHESSELRLDSSKAEKLLKWKPVKSIDTSIKNIVEWEKNYIINKSNLVSIKQITEYFD